MTVSSQIVTAGNLRILLRKRLSPAGAGWLRQAGFQCLGGTYLCHLAGRTGIDRRVFCTLFLCLAFFLHDVVLVNWPVRVYHHLSNNPLPRALLENASAMPGVSCLDLPPIVTTNLEFSQKRLPAAERQTQDICLGTRLNFFVLLRDSEPEVVCFSYLFPFLFLPQMLADWHMSMVHFASADTHPKCQLAAVPVRNNKALLKTSDIWPKHWTS